jgi:two-component system chemotaxis response regulator CheB
MPKIRVLVVEDSITMRKRLLEVLAGDPEIEVVGETDNGKRAIELCREHRPDVITLDMMLPSMSGLAATEYIMAHFPTPILVVSASINRGELFHTYDALAAGAVDVLEKPNGTEPDGVWEAHFLSTVKLVSRIKVITHPRGRLGAVGRSATRSISSEWLAPTAKEPYRVLALGASTGGPGAIVELLRALPAHVTLPILVVIHIGEPFGTALADWLDAQTPRRVSYPRDGEPLAAVANRVILAPPNSHLVVDGGTLRLTTAPERHSCRPSVDVLFESVAREVGSASAACLLTGMGRDGASGLLEIRRSGGLTIAQDEATSIVYGMPREAALIGAAEHVLPLDAIGPALERLCTTKKRGEAR